MLSVTHVFALLPVLSIAVPHISCPELSVVTVIGVGQTAMPEVASAHVKLTVTSVLFQPFAFGIGVAVAVIVGDVLSMLIVAGCAVLGYTICSGADSLLYDEQFTEMLREPISGTKAMFYLMYSGYPGNGITRCRMCVY